MKFYIYADGPHTHANVTRRKLRSQTSDSWTDAATVVRAGREEKEPERKSQEKEDREKVEKLRSTMFFDVLWLWKVEK